MAKIEISIVICTHKRANLLKGAIQSLVEQSLLPDCFEVIIVDNDTKENPDIKNIVERTARHISIRYLHEKNVGLSYARNRGGKNAIADYVAYMDDDAKASPQYIENLIGAINEYKPDICGGACFPFYLSSKPKWFLDKYGSEEKGDKPRYLMFNEYLGGGNIIFRRGLLEELGWFSPKYGMSGKKIGYGEETDLIIRAWKNYPRLKVFYDPRISVHHLVPAYKMRILNTLRIAYAKGKSQAYFWIPKAKYSIARQKAPLNFALLVIYLFGSLFPGVIFRNHNKFPFWQNFIVEKISDIVQSIGVQLQLTKDLICFIYK